MFSSASSGGRTDVRRLPLFAGCSPRDLRKLDNLGTQVSVRPGQELLVEGRRGAEVILVLHGEAVCDVAGREVARFGAGHFFGEIAALDGRPRTATVKALTDMDVLVLDRGEFDRMFDLSPEVARRVLTAMAQRLRAADDLALESA
jgi:CRP/FNR family transcriptional regulator, cyclic AMP receptor protein